MEDDGFQLVLRKHKRRKLPNVSYRSYVDRFDQVPLQQIDLVVENALKKMKDSMFLNVVVEMVKDVLLLEKNARLIQIRAIGVGHFSGYEPQDYGCHQIALLLLLKEHFGCEVTFQDPVTTENEKSWLRSRNIRWLKSTSLRECDVCADPGSYTLFFMPHCDVALYNSLIYAHRTAVHLKNIIILGNNLVSFNVDVRYKDELSVLIAYRKVCKCLPLPSYDTSPFSFNNSAIHFLDKLHPKFSDVEPQYDYYKILCQ